jgi:isopropylmalate/homocitrate/citramalate synthase
MHDPQSDMIYDWNTMDGEVFPKVEVDDETLRDGLQSPSVKEPSLDQKINILESMISLGIKRGDIGLPMSAQLDDIKGLLAHITKHNRPFAPGLAVRTVISDLQHIADLQQQFGIPIKAEAFLGCSRIRQMVEGWDLKFLLEKTQEAIAFAKKNQMPIMFVTEDTTRAYPSDLREIYGAAIDAGADEICIADTVGHATPSGARAVTLAVKNLLIEKKSTHVLLNWHGHSDRGLAVINSLEAAKAGADILHASGIGIGERSGNTPMDQLLVNLKLLNRWDHPLQGLAHYVELVSQSVDMPISKNYPVFGEDAFRTATGVHAAAIIKAIKLGRSDLADVIYSGVPAHLFGLKQEIEIGRMSGKSNVIFWLSSHHLPTDDTLVNQILTCAHESRTVLSEQTLMKIVQDWQNTLT